MKTRTTFSSKIWWPTLSVMAFGVLFLAIKSLGLTQRSWWWPLAFISLPALVWFLVALVENVLREMRAIPWRKRIKMGDKCEFRNVKGSFTQARVKLLGENDKVKVLLELDTFYVTSPRWVPLSELYPR